jgi:hypothetical protein
VPPGCGCCAFCACTATLAAAGIHASIIANRRIVFDCISALFTNAALAPALDI